MHSTMYSTCFLWLENNLKLKVNMLAKTNNFWDDEPKKNSIYTNGNIDFHRHIRCKLLSTDCTIVSLYIIKHHEVVVDWRFLHSLSHGRFLGATLTKSSHPNSCNTSRTLYTPRQWAKCKHPTCLGHNVRMMTHKQSLTSESVHFSIECVSTIIQNQLKISYAYTFKPVILKQYAKNKKEQLRSKRAFCGFSRPFFICSFSMWFWL